MHVGYVTSKYPAVSHTFIQREVNGLRQLGHRVTTFSVRRPAEKELLTAADMAEARTTHYLLPAKPWTLVSAIVKTLVTEPGRFFKALGTAWKIRLHGVRGTVWYFFYFLEALLMHRICVQEKITHVHAHFANVASDVALLVSVLNGGTYSFTMHGPTEFYDLKEHRLLEKAMRAKFVVCISDFARSQLMGMLPPEEWEKLEVVHCGVDPQQFYMVREHRSGGDVSPVNILCVARMAPVKGHAVLLQAVSELLIRGYHVSLTLAGDGPLRRDLERLADTLSITERVHFLGNVGQDVIHQHYARADLFVLPSFAEGVPVVLMEAMAAQCPVVATRIAGIPELVEHGVTGMLAAPGRADLLADAIERLLVSPQAAERMAHAAFEKVRREFNLLKVAPQLAAIFRQRLEKPGVGVAIDPRTRGVDHRAVPAYLARPGHHSVRPRTPTDSPRGAA